MNASVDKRDFRHATGAAVVLLAALGAGLAPLWVILHRQWTDVSMYRHGYLVAAMSGWLAWRAIRAHPLVRLSPDWRYLMPLAGVLAGVVLLDFLYLNVPRLYLLPPLVVCCAGLVFGQAVAMRVVWPVLLIYGALPIWPVINGTLQSLTTAVVSRALAASDVPAFIEGNFVRLPAGTFEIAEACSGLKYVVVGTTLALFYGLAFLPRWRHRLLLLAVTLPSVIVCNWVRVYTVILAGHLTDMQHYLVSVEHRTFGWAVFVVFLVPLFILGRRLDGPGDAPASAASAPMLRGRAMLAAALAGALLLHLPRAATVAFSDAGQVAPAAFATANEGPDSPWLPVFVNALEERLLVGASGAAIDVYRAVYVRQDPSHKLIAFHNTFVPATWQAVGEGRRTIAVGGARVEALEFEGYLDGRRRLVWAWYSVAGRPAAGPLEAKVLELRGLLLEGRRDAAALAVSIECGLDCSAARERLAAFLVHPPQHFLQ